MANDCFHEIIGVDIRMREIDDAMQVGLFPQYGVRTIKACANECDMNRGIAQKLFQRLVGPRAVSKISDRYFIHSDTIHGK